MCFYKFENKSARILHIGVGEGQTLAIPPTEGGVTIEVQDADKPAFQANIQTPAVQAWINDGQLTITEVEEAPPPDPPVRQGDEPLRKGDDQPPTEPPPPESPAREREQDVFPSADRPLDEPTPGEGDTPQRGRKRGRHEGE